MPKLKTNRSALRRFRMTAHGFKLRHAFRNHILTKKASKLKSHLANNGCQVDHSDLAAVKRLFRAL